MKTVSMMRTDREKKVAADRFSEPMSMGSEDYPYGLHLNLDDGTMKKLGITDMPKLRDKYRIEGLAHVVGANDMASTDGSNRELRLVLHELGMEPAGAMDEPEREKSIREELEDARHQAAGSTATKGRIGARAAGSAVSNGAAKT